MRTIKLLLALSLATCQPAYADRILSGDIVEGVVTQKNYLGNKAHFEKNAAGWSGYDDAAATPVDGTAGTVTTTCTRTTTAPLSGDGSFLYTPAALGEGCSTSFTVDSKDKGKVLQLSFEYTVSSGTYTDDDTTIWIYDVTNAALIQPAPYKIKKTGITEKFAVEFQTSSSSTSYRLLIHQATAGTAVLKFDNFQLGPQAKLYGSAVTDYVAFTPTVSVSTNVSNLTGFKRRVGDSAEYIVFIAFNGTNTQGAVTITQPAGETIDTAKLSNTGSDRDVHGLVHIIDSGTSSLTGNVKVESSTSVALNVQGSAGTYTTRTPINTATGVPMTIASGDSFYVQYKVPIVGWSSSQIMSSDADTRLVSFRVEKTSGNHSSSGSYQDITWNASATKDTHGGFNGTTSYTVKTPGDYRISAGVTFAANATGTRSAKLIVNSTTVAALDIGVSAVHSTTIPLTATYPLVAGDVVKVQGFQDSGGNLNYGSSAGYTHFEVEKIQGPAQVVASDTVAALYTGAPPTGTLTNAYNITTFGTKVKDSHNAYSSGSYTIPVSGVYSITAGARHDATYALNKLSVIAIFVDGVQKQTKIEIAGGAVLYLFPQVSVHSLPLLAGQVVTIRSYNDATTPTFGSQPGENFFSIIRTGNF